MKFCSLQYRNVRLDLLHLSHAKDLVEHGSDQSIWDYLPRSPLSDVAVAEEYINNALKEYSDGRRVPFAIVDVKNDRVVGSTSFGEIRKEHRSVEIGWTWLGVKYQRTEFNTTCKYLLLKNAFEDNNCIRVELKTDSRNFKSQRAIERFGALREGVHRNHMVLPDGTYRDSVYYSVIDRDWPAIKARFSRYIETECPPITTCG